MKIVQKICMCIIVLKCSPRTPTVAGTTTELVLSILAGAFVHALSFGFVCFFMGGSWIL